MGAAAKRSAYAAGIGICAAIAVAAAVVTACDDSSGAVKENAAPPGSSGPGSSGMVPPVDAGSGDGAASDCVVDPKTHEEIINACTDAVKIAKNPVLPLLREDGGLPPLP